MMSVALPLRKTESGHKGYFSHFVLQEGDATKSLKGKKMVNSVWPTPDNKETDHRINHDLYTNRGLTV